MSGLQETFDKDFEGKRFQVKEYPYGISTGYFYVVEDTFEEMDDISFDSAWDEAEQFGIFVNDLFESYCKELCLREGLSDFFDRYEKSLEFLEDKYFDVDEAKHNVLLELDKLVNEKDD